VKGNIEATHFV